MHESSLATSVLTVLRSHPGPHRCVRVTIADISSTTDELAERLRTHLAAADPPVEVTDVEVVLRARERLCAGCATAWVTAEVDPACPSCGGAPLPVGHDHRLEVELLE